MHACFHLYRGDCTGNAKNCLYPHAVEVTGEESLREDLAAYVRAVAESTQTPMDMAGTALLSILSVCLQGKYRVQGKADWTEPLNTYALVIATPSERKSAVLSLMLRPLNLFEAQYNRRNAPAVEASRSLGVGSFGGEYFGRLFRCQAEDYKSRQSSVPSELLKYEFYIPPKHNKSIV